MRGSCSCISAPLFHLSCHCPQLPSHQAPSSLGLSTIVKLLPLCTTKIYCTACISSYAVQCSTASAPMVGYSRSRELIEAENPLHPCTLHPLASTCSSAALLAPLAIPPSPLVQSSLFNTFETPLGCLPPTDLAAHWQPLNEIRIQKHFCYSDTLAFV